MTVWNKIILMGAGFILVACAQLGLKTRSSLKDSNTQASAIKKPSWEEVSEELAQQLRVSQDRLEELEHRLNQLEKSRSDDKTREMIQSLTEELKAQRQEIQDIKAQLVALIQSRSHTENGDHWEVAQQAYESGDCQKAVLSFQKARQNLPMKQLDRWAEATFKMAQCLERLGMKEEARAFWEELVEKAPQSKWAKKSPIKGTTTKRPRKP